jgi:hypothetical protein
VISGGVFGLLVRSAENKIESAPGRGEAFDPDTDKAGRRWEVLQWIGYGVGAAAVIGGIVLIATARPPVEAAPPAPSPAPPPRVTLAPLLGPQAGGAILRVAF